MKKPSIDRRRKKALKQCYEALWQLAHHPAFGGDAPEFNHGGIGYEAMQAFNQTVPRSAGATPRNRPTINL